MRMLFPDAVGVVDPVSVHSDLPRNELRPSVRLNMIVSVDGGTSWGGVSGALGGPADKALFGVLRSFADVVLVAAGTMRAEKYGPVQMSHGMQDTRRNRGQAPIPPVAVVSRSCQMDWETPFFTAAVARPLVVTVAAAAAVDRTRAAAVADVIVAGDRDVDLSAALDELAVRGSANVLAEGGADTQW